MIKGIVCCDRKYGIGKNNSLLFKLKGDMKLFREQTLHKVVVMGYSTYMSLPKRPLPDRINIILWDKATSLDCLPNCITFNDFAQLLTFINILNSEFDIYICGGASIYKLFLPYYDEVLINFVDAEDKEATVFFPNLDEDKNFHLAGIGAKIDDSGYTTQLHIYERSA